MRKRRNTQPDFIEICARREMTRREFLRAGGMLGLAAATAPLAGCLKTEKPLAGLSDSTLTFTEIAKNTLDRPMVAPGYSVTRLISWGDPLSGKAGEFRPADLTPEGQAVRFGYNNDYTAFMPLPWGSKESAHGLLFVNHEYTCAHLMFPGLTREKSVMQVTQPQVRIEQEANGFSVLEVKRDAEGEWRTAPQSVYARRGTATTLMRISGPAKGHRRLQTKYDPRGVTLRGTLANCAGGVTPWGTVLTAEENFHSYFGGLEKGAPEYRNYARYGIGEELYNGWYRHDARFDVSKTPNEPNRFGWVVEIDPYRPEKAPIKRTALGRFKHECANCTVAADGRVAVYSGDDEAFEYIYRFITAKPYSPDNREANDGLLDEGTLSVARFDEGGTVEWLPLIYGRGKLTEKNGFHSQADVVIETRRAADLLGATPMDRPEDVEVNPATGQLFIALTRNDERRLDDVGALHRRAPDPFGLVLELSPPLKDGTPDHTADMFFWEIFLEGGDPVNTTHKAYYPHFVSQHGWLTNPDNLAFDPKGRMWICTDGQPKAIGLNDGLYAADTTGKGKGETRLFFTVPRGAEMTGPSFTPDGKSLFLSVQHPGDGEGAGFAAPGTRWPDFSENTPPRPSVVVITKDDGGEIGVAHPGGLSS